MKMEAKVERGIPLPIARKPANARPTLIYLQISREYQKSPTYRKMEFPIYYIG